MKIDNIFIIRSLINPNTKQFNRLQDFELQPAWNMTHALKELQLL